MFIISQVIAHVRASGATSVFVLESPRTFVECEVPLFMMVSETPAPILAAFRGYDVDSRLFRCGSIKSTLVPCLLPVYPALFCFSREHPFWYEWHKNFHLFLAHCIHSSLNVPQLFIHSFVPFLHFFYIFFGMFLSLFDGSFYLSNTCFSLSPGLLPSNSSYPGSRSCWVLFPSLILGGSLHCISTFCLSHSNLSSRSQAPLRLFLFP